MSQYVKYFELASFLLGLLHWKWIRKDDFIKGLVFVTGIITLVDFTGYFLWKNHIPNLWYYNIIGVPVVFISYYFVFYKNICTARSKAQLGSLITVSMVLYALGLFLMNPKEDFNTLGYCMASIILVTFVVVKIKNIISDKNEIDFLRNPLVYVLLSLLLYYLCTIPFYSISHYSTTQDELNSLLTFFYYVTALLNINLYTSYCVLFICQKKK